MEIQIFTPTSGEPLPPIQWNYSEVKKWLEDGLAAYKGRVYTDSTIGDAKKDRAGLNKIADVIDGKRKEMKAKYLQPYEEFEAQAKELVAMVKEQSAAIDVQVKAYEQTQREKKLNDIKEVYAALIGDLEGLVPYDKLHNPKWLNVTASPTAVVAELGGKIDRIRAGLDSINSLGLDADIAEQVKGVFLKDFDLAEALAIKEHIEKRREELAKYEAAKAAQKVEEEQYTPAEVQEEPTEQVKPAPAEDVEIHTVAFRVWATSSQLEALKSFLKNNNIKYGRA
jgi:predicted regulator of Ras-like GTPase activity (Roadblock/LC7/MglB family)